MYCAFWILENITFSDFGLSYLSIDNGSILDVVEMDAASNNGVDDIRDLRDETAYTPSACKYKLSLIHI